MNLVKMMEPLAQRMKADPKDLLFVVALGILYLPVKLAEVLAPWAHFTGTTTNAIAFVTTMVYIIARARREPEKLDEWGITTPITLPAVVIALGLLAGGIAMLGATSLLLGGSPSFRPALLPQAIEYIAGAFPQQFVLCSIRISALSKFPVFRGWWRLPVAMSVLFYAAHLWSPLLFPNTTLLIQLFPMLGGLVFTVYFMYFRNIIPTTLLHAFSFPFLVHWVESIL